RPIGSGRRGEGRQRGPDSCRGRRRACRRFGGFLADGLCRHDPRLAGGGTTACFRPPIGLRVDISSLIDSLHPLEIKVLTAFGANPSGAVLTTEQLAVATGLEPSQLSMAIEWLLAKSLLSIDKETVTPVVSMTAVGERYHAKQSPIEEVLAAARSVAGTGQRLTIQDLQSRDGLDPSDVSKAVGR